MKTAETKSLAETLKGLSESAEKEGYTLKPKHTRTSFQVRFVRGGRLIAEVVQRRTRQSWLPASGYGQPELTRLVREFVAALDQRVTSR